MIESVYTIRRTKPLKDISLRDFIDEGWESQQKYADASGIKGPYNVIPTADRYQLIVNNLGHLMEEVIEARREVVRRPWKKDEKGCLDSKEKRAAFIEEMFDVLLFFRATLAYAGVSGEDFVEAAFDKLSYNSTREDHKTNAAK
jgi:NTP pyrophosphatase (non-canonical NTP hydrolase)